MKLRETIAAMAVVLTAVGLGLAADPVVSNVRAAQRLGTPYVDITYDLADVDTATLDVAVAVSTNGGAVYFTPAEGLNGHVGSVARGTGRKAVWDAGIALPPKLFNNVRVQVTANDVKTNIFTMTCQAVVGSAAPTGKVFVNKPMKWNVSGIPAGTYTLNFQLSPPTYNSQKESFAINDSFSIENTYFDVGRKYFSATVTRIDAAGITHIGTCSGLAMAVPYDGTVIEQ